MCFPLVEHVGLQTNYMYLFFDEIQIYLFEPENCNFWKEYHNLK